MSEILWGPTCDGRCGLAPGDHRHGTSTGGNSQLVTAAVPDPRFRDQLAGWLDDIAARLQPRLDESDAEWVMSTFIAPLFGNGDAADLAEVLAKHRSLPLMISWAAYPGCSCGWFYPADSHGGERLAAFEQHRANALLPVVEARVRRADGLRGR